MKNYKLIALTLDEKDSLKRFKHEFIQDENLIYLDGNSLGKLPKKSIQLTAEIVQNQWGNRLIRSWNENWIHLADTIAKKIAKLLGVNASEIFVGDTTSLNLFKLAFAALDFQKDKNLILSDTFNFPSDLYILEGLLKNQFKNHTLELINTSFNSYSNYKLFEEKLNEKTAFITLSHVAFKSSYMYDMKSINALSKKHNSMVLWDLSHSIGAVPINLRDSGTELAVGCTYKYLNGGPGSPAFIYVKKELQHKLNNPISSWFGHAKPFDFNKNFEPSQSINKFAISTPGILSMAPIDIGVDLILDAGIENLRIKSLKQSRFLIELISEYLTPLGFKIASPSNEESIGSHISIEHEEAYRINRALIEPLTNCKTIIPDFRPPNNIRLGITPLYTSFSDLFETVVRIKSIVLEKEYERFSKTKLIVT